MPIHLLPTEILGNQKLRIYYLDRPGDHVGAEIQMQISMLPTSDIATSI